MNNNYDFDIVGQGMSGIQYLKPNSDRFKKFCQENLDFDDCQVNPIMGIACDHRMISHMMEEFRYMFVYKHDLDNFIYVANICKDELSDGFINDPEYVNVLYPCPHLTNLGNEIFKLVDSFENDRDNVPLIWKHVRNEIEDAQRDGDDRYTDVLAQMLDAYEPEYLSEIHV